MKMALRLVGCRARSYSVASMAAVKPFDEIPGPKSLPLIGTLWNYLPFIGRYAFDTLHKNGRSKLEEYGAVVREQMVPGVNVVWIFHPSDYQELLRKEGRFPQRVSHLALLQYRTRQQDVYRTGGLLPTNGEEWWHLRTKLQRGLSAPRDCRKHLPAVGAVLEELVQLVRGVHPEGQEDVLPLLSRAYLEMLGVVAFDTRLNALHLSESAPSSRSSRLIQSALDINSCILRTDNGPRLWRYFNTPLYRRLAAAHRYMDQAALSLVQEKQREMSQNGPSQDPSLLEQYLTSPELNIADVMGMAADMLLAGIDTTTYTTSFALYHLATNPDKQKLLYLESKQVLEHPTSPILADTLTHTPYLKAVLKESLRLNPVSVGVGRVLAEDAVFSGYSVPKGTLVVTQNQVTCRLEQYFKDADSFVPERWLKGSDTYEAVSPYLSLPFGHGPRTCIARRLAEQNIQVLLLKICRNFELSWRGGVLDCKSLLINKPDQPILIAFKPRD